MFKLTPPATFPATVRIPNGDEPIPLTLVFRRKSKADLAAWIDSTASRNDPDSLGEIIADWKNVETAYSSDALTEVLSAYSGAGLAIFTGYLKALSEAERKN